MKKLFFIIFAIILFANTAVAGSRTTLEDGSGVELGTVGNPFNVNLTSGGVGGSGTPGGSDTQVQYNDSGSFGGDAGMVYNETTNALTVSGTITTGGVNVNSGSEKILTSSGSVTLGGTGNTNNEKLLLDFESVANKLTLTSSTGLATIDYGSIAADYDSSTVTLSTVAGAINAASATSLAIPNGAAPTVSTFGQIAGDNNLWATSHGAPIFYDGTASVGLVGVLVSDTPTNGQVPTWNTGGTITWETGSGGSGFTTAGRSLTGTGATIDADAELYTDSKTLYFENPTSSDDFKTIAVAPTAWTITSISCESDQTVNFDLQVDDGSAAGVNGSDIACTTFATDSSLAGDTTMAAGDRLDLAVTSVSGTPTWVSITYTYTKDE